jgi:hypothetical protein
MTAMTLAGAGVVALLGVDAPVVPAGAAVGTLLGAVGLAQLGTSLRRMLGD